MISAFKIAHNYIQLSDRFSVDNSDNSSPIDKSKVRKEKKKLQKQKKQLKELENMKEDINEKFKKIVESQDEGLSEEQREKIKDISSSLERAGLSPGDFHVDILSTPNKIILKSGVEIEENTLRNLSRINNIGDMSVSNNQITFIWE